MYLQTAACNELTTERKEIAMEKIPYKIYLSEDEMPKYWFNLRAKMKELPEPFVNPGTGEGEIVATLAGATLNLDFVEFWHSPPKHIPYTGTKL